MKIAEQQKNIYNFSDLEKGNILFNPKYRKKIDNLIYTLRDKNIKMLDVACHKGYVKKIFPSNWDYNGIDIIDNGISYIKQGDLTEKWNYNDNEFELEDMFPTLSTGFIIKAKKC